MELTAPQIKKYSKKTLPQLVKKAQQVFNAWIRKRDLDGDYFTCISCDEVKHKSLMHASHYMSAGNYQAVRFHEDNVHGACSKCNTHLSGNLIEYRKRLVKKIGADRVEWLENFGRTVKKHDKITLITIIEKYK